MAVSYRLDLAVQTHTKAEMAAVKQALIDALKPLKLDGTIWTYDGSISEVITPETVNLE